MGGLYSYLSEQFGLVYIFYSLHLKMDCRRMANKEIISIGHLRCRVLNWIRVEMKWTWQ